MKNVLVFLTSTLLTLSLHAQTTNFTYQGKLTESGAPASGAYLMEFRLFDAVSGGAQIGATVSNPAVDVANGFFTVSLDFGSSPFNGADRYLEIAVKRNAGDPFTVLSPRQQITSSPYAIQAQKAQSAESATTAFNVTGLVQIENGGTGSSVKNFVDLSNDQLGIGGNKTFTGTVSVNGSGVFSGNGSGLTNLNGANITGGSILSAALSSALIPNSTDLKLLGSLRWDLLKTQSNFTVGSAPTSVAFDGTNIWVANSGSSNVSKIRVNDGTVLGTFAVGTSPQAIAFDGANIWVANSGGNNVTKLSAIDGSNLGTFPTGTNPVAIAFDGTNVWIANRPSGPVNGSVTKLRASDGANQGTFPVGIAPFAIAFDGAVIWVTTESGTVNRFRASDSSPLTSVSAVGAAGIAFDGSFIWITSASGSTVTKVRAGDGSTVGAFNVGTSPRGVAFDGSNIWVTNSGNNSVTKLRAVDGALLSTFSVGLDPRGIAFDGAAMWIAVRGSTEVTRMLPAFPN